MSNLPDNSLDYKRFEDGDLVMAFDRTLYDLNFQVNSDGQLVVIGVDADNYSIDINGNLIYQVLEVGIGTMIIGSTFIVG